MTPVPKEQDANNSDFYTTSFSSAEFLLLTEGLLSGLNCMYEEDKETPAQRRVTHKNIKYLLDGNHVCCLCGYKSVNSSNVVYHVRSRHTGHRPYGCSKCDF